MCHRMMTVSRIDKSSDLLDSGHWDSARVALYFGSMDRGLFFLSILETMVLLSK